MLKSKFFLVVISASLGAAVAVFFLWETRLSLSVLSWHWKFERELNEKGSVKLAELVNFKFEKVYFLDPHDGNWEAEKDLFPAWSWTDPFWWGQSRGYWTIAYKRSGRPPFLIKMNAYQWYLREPNYPDTVDPDARLRAVQPNTIESTYCRQPRARCIALDDTESRVLTEPYVLRWPKLESR